MSPASSFFSAASCSFFSRSRRDSSTRIAAARFWIWDFSFCMETTTPVAGG